MLFVKFFQFNPFQENSYILYNSNQQAWLIDPGMFTAAECTIYFNFITENKLQPLQIINTHCHIDHILGVQACMDKYNIPFIFCDADVDTFNWAPASAYKFGFPTVMLPTYTTFSKDIGTMHLGQDAIQVLYTPGHSQGSVSFYSKAASFVIAGDVLFSGSIGRTDLPGGDFTILEKSIKEQLYTLPNDTTVFCGHGPSTSIGAEKSSNPFVR